MAISFVAATDVNSSSGGTSLTINKPSGVASGDVLVMAVGIQANTNPATFTAPSGWTKVRTMVSSNAGEIALCIMTKIAGGSEPSTYGPSFTSANHYYAVCAAYRGASGNLLAENFAGEAIAASPLATPSVSNTDSDSWRLAVGYFSDGAGDTVTSISTNEVSRRGPAAGGSPATDGGYYYGIQFYDSNGAVATGSHSRTFSGSGASFWTAFAWIGILEEGGALPASGTINQTLGAVSASMDGDVHNDATIAMQLGSVTMSGAGYGQPPPIDGSMAVQLDQVGMAFDAGVPPSGSFSMTLQPAVAFSGETRVFGVRVIRVEAEDRTIRVQSRGVDD